MTTSNDGLTYTDFLEHYGVPGMKWGKRKNRSSGSDSSNVKPARTKKTKPVKADVKKMSDKELRDKINRMQMEQQYAKLTGTKEGRATLEKGQKIFKQTMAVIDTANRVYGVYNSPLGKLARDEYKKRF